MRLPSKSDSVSCSGVVAFGNHLAVLPTASVHLIPQDWAVARGQVERPLAHRHSVADRLCVEGQGICGFHGLEEGSEVFLLALLATSARGLVAFLIDAVVGVIPLDGL